MSRKTEQIDITKVIVMSILLLSLFSSSSVLLTMYPQRLLVDNSTSIDSILKFTDKGITLRGNQIQPSSDDIIPLNGRDYVRITSRQIQIGDNTYREGVRTVNPLFSQNIWFSQYIGEFQPTQSVKIGIDNEVIILTPSFNTIKVQTPESDSYTIQFKDNVTYLKSKSVMLRLEKTDKIRVYLIGFKETNSIWLKVN